MKTCTKCKQEFPATTEYFYHKPGNKYNVDSSCKVCHRAAKKEWFNNNKEVKAARDKKRYEEKKDYILAVNREYYRNNTERHKTKGKAWRQANPEKSRESNRKREALKRNNGHSPYTEQQVLETYGTNCNICSLPVDLTAPRQVGIPGWENGLHIDHLLPISKGGPDMLSNVRPTHGLCNLSKSDKEKYETKKA